jgi:hypothetical protein
MTDGTTTKTLIQHAQYTEPSIAPVEDQNHNSCTCSENDMTSQSTTAMTVEETSCQPT